MTVLEREFALAFAAYEREISATFLGALVREPNLRCVEWERRNPFVQPLDVGSPQQKRALLRAAG